MDEARVIERSFSITKLKLLEVFPLYPFLHGRDRLRCVEVGANIGLWCEAFHDVFGHRIASYRAYEPLPGNAQRFSRRALHHLPDSHIDLVQACVGDKAGEVVLNYNRAVTTLASVPVSYMKVGNAVIDNSQRLAVPQVTLDEEVTEPVDIVKIDTEGYEWQVLEGATEAIDSGRVDNVYFEFGVHQGYLGQTFRQFFDFFAERGFRLYRQAVARNYFGLKEILRYERSFEDYSSMWMVLASRHGVPAEYRGPRVVSRFDHSRQSRRRRMFAAVDRHLRHRLARWLPPEE